MQSLEKLWRIDVQLSSKRGIFCQRQWFERARFYPVGDAAGPIYIETANGHDAPCDAVKCVHQRFRLWSGTEDHIDHNVWSKGFKILLRFGDLLPVTYDVFDIRRQGSSAFATVKHGDAMAEALQFTHHGRPNEASPTNHEDLHNQK